MTVDRSGFGRYVQGRFQEAGDFSRVSMKVRRADAAGTEIE